MNKITVKAMVRVMARVMDKAMGKAMGKAMARVMDKAMDKVMDSNSKTMQIIMHMGYSLSLTTISSNNNKALTIKIIMLINHKMQATKTKSLIMDNRISIIVHNISM